MKKIQIFLASNDELKDDRDEIADFISDKLNNIYKPYGVAVELFRWEDINDAFLNERVEDVCDRNVQASDLLVALFYTEAHHYTVQEVDKGMEALRNNNRPKVCIYYKFLSDRSLETAELKQFKDRVLNELGHFTAPDYKHTDSLLLNITMQVARIEHCDNLKPEFRGDDLYINSEKVADTANVKFMANNEGFQKKKAELAELKADVDKLRAKLARHPDDEDYKDDLYNALRRYNNLKEEIETDEKNLFDTALRMVKLQDEKITDRMRRAIEAFENGDVSRTNIILEEAEHDADILLQTLVKEKETARKSVDELRLKAKTMMADSSVPMMQRIGNTEVIFKKAIELAKECDYEEGEYAKLLYNYGSFLHDLNKFNDAQTYYEEALVITRKLAVDNTCTNLQNLANTLNNIAVLHYDCHKYEMAESEYVESLEISRKLAESNPDAFLPDLAATLQNIAVLHDDCHKYEMAESEYVESLEICRKLAESNPDAFLSDFARTLQNIASLHSGCHKYEMAESEYVESLEISRKLAESNPDAFLPDFARTLQNIAGLHKGCHKYEMAESEYVESLEIYRKLAESNPDAFLPDLAQTLQNIAILHDGFHKYEMAESEYVESLEIYRKLAESNPDAFVPALARTLNGLSYAYAHQSKFPEALSSINEAVSLMPENPNYYDSKGEILLMMNDEENARKMYEKVIELDSKFYENTKSSLGDKFADELN